MIVPHLPITSQSSQIHQLHCVIRSNFSTQVPTFRLDCCVLLGFSGTQEVILNACIAENIVMDQVLLTLV